MKKIFISIILILSLTFVGCHYDECFEDPKITFPSGAEKITTIGDGWFTFYLDDKKFLYHKVRNKTGHRGYECITQIIGEEE